jgi:hypothetical protein
MNPTFRCARLAGLAWLATCLPLPGAELVEGRSSIVLENSSSRLVLDLAGGSIGDFHLRDSGLNPLRWATPAPGHTGIQGFGHFLCLDRWGAPSDAEGAQGMPYHGEASHVSWNVVRDTAEQDGAFEAQISASLPKAGLSIRRTLRLARKEAAFSVREEITNDRALGRIYNAVQHPTIGPPFLDESTLVDCNGRRGFAQGRPMPNPEEPSADWPQAWNQNGQQVDLRRLAADPHPNVVSYTLDTTHGWVTAATPAQGLLIGYLWKTADYPWVSLWRDVREGRPAARGLEFGTTGLHQPFPILVKKGRIWDRPLFEHLDAGETTTKSYTVFLCRIPKDFAGVESIQVKPNQLRLREHAGGQGREWTVDTTGLYPAQGQP